MPRMRINPVSVLNHPTLAFKGYEFTVIGGIYIPEAQMTAHTFRLEIDKNTLQASILVAGEETWYVHDDCTEHFNVAYIISECHKHEQAGRIYDATEDYFDFHKREKEEELVCL